MISIYVQYHTHVMQNVNMDTPQCLQILSANAVAPAGKGPPGLGQLRGMDGGQVKKLTNCILMLIKPGNLFVGPKQVKGFSRTGGLVQSHSRPPTFVLGIQQGLQPMAGFTSLL